MSACQGGKTHQITLPLWDGSAGLHVFAIPCLHLPIHDGFRGQRMLQPLIDDLDIVREFVRDLLTVRVQFEDGPREAVVDRIMVLAHELETVRLLDPDFDDPTDGALGDGDFEIAHRNGGLMVSLKALAPSPFHGVFHQAGDVSAIKFMENIPSVGFHGIGA